MRYTVRLESDHILFDAKSVAHVRVDKIGGAGDGLWWVALAFIDGSTKPEGMFTSQDDAMQLAQELSASWHVDLAVKTDL